MYPILFKIGPFTIYTYGVFISGGFLVAISLFLRATKKEDFPEAKILKLSFWIVILSIIGARISYVLTYPHWYLKHPQAILKIWQGGLVFYGGLVFALVTSFCLLHHYHLPFWRIANIAASPLALGMSIGRVGCFFNGCCYGKVWERGLVFPALSPAGKAFPGQPLIPTQLISSLNLLVIFFILIHLKRYPRFAHQIFLWFLILYSGHRFAIGFLRADCREALFYLTIPQFMSIILGISAIVLMARRRRERKLVN